MQQPGELRVLVGGRLEHPPGVLRFPGRLRGHLLVGRVSGWHLVSGCRRERPGGRYLPGGLTRGGLLDGGLLGGRGRVILADHVGVAAAVHRLIQLIEPGEPSVRRRTGVAGLARLRLVAARTGITLSRVARPLISLPRVPLRRIPRLAWVRVLPGVPGRPGIATLSGIANRGLIARLSGVAGRVAILGRVARLPRVSLLARVASLRWKAVRRRGSGAGRPIGRGVIPAGCVLGRTMLSSTVIASTVRGASKLRGGTVWWGTVWWGTVWWGTVWWGTVLGGTVLGGSVL